jgi:hypothetical protein
VRGTRRRETILAETDAPTIRGALSPRVLVSPPGTPSTPTWRTERAEPRDHIPPAAAGAGLRGLAGDGPRDARRSAPRPRPDPRGAGRDPRRRDRTARPHDPLLGTGRRLRLRAGRDDRPPLRRPHPQGTAGRLRDRGRDPGGGLRSLRTRVRDGAGRPPQAPLAPGRLRVRRARRPPGPGLLGRDRAGARGAPQAGRRAAHRGASLARGGHGRVRLHAAVPAVPHDATRDRPRAPALRTDPGPACRSPAGRDRDLPCAGASRGPLAGPALDPRLRARRRARRGGGRVPRSHPPAGTRLRRRGLGLPPRAAALPRPRRGGRRDLRRGARPRGRGAHPARGRAALEPPVRTETPRSPVSPRRPSPAPARARSSGAPWPRSTRPPGRGGGAGGCGTSRG